MSSYQLGAKVWVKMPDYPWWPGFVVDAAECGADLSLRMPGQDVCVQCLPSAAPSVMFINSQSAEEIRPYGGREADRELIAAGAAHPECAPAVTEALAAFEVSEDATAALAVATDLDVDATLDLLLRAEADTEGKAPGGSSDDDDDDEDDERAMLNLASAVPDGGGEAAGETEEEKAERKRLRKIQKKAEKAARKKGGKDKKEKSKKSKRRGRGESSDEDDDDDEVAPRRLKKAGGKRPSGRADVDPRDMRQTALDAYMDEAARPPKLPKFAEDDLDYYTRRLRQRRQTVSDGVLAMCAAGLKAVMSECLENNAYAEEEDALLEMLRPLASYDVSYVQLGATGIGAVVGGLLKQTFPHRVGELAHGILTYWFHTLPNTVQAELATDSELDRCSAETTAGTRSDGVEGNLGTVGLHLYDSFAEEEIYDAPSGTNVADICQRIETLLREKKSHDLDARVLVLATIGDPANVALRRRILDGSITPEDIIANTNDLGALLGRGSCVRRPPNIRTDFAGVSTTGSPMGPFSPYSPTGFGGGGEGGGSPGFTSAANDGLSTFTTANTCPRCGAAEAYRREYTVQAHDNYPEIFHCRRCNNTWNIT